MLTKPCKVIEHENHDPTKIYGNGHAREVLYWFDLTEEEQAEFDFSDKEDSTYFRYKGNAYTLGDFMRVDSNSPFSGFADGYHSDSYFSGVLVKYTECGDGVKVYTYIS